jgi:hypothetical protein
MSCINSIDFLTFGDNLAAEGRGHDRRALAKAPRKFGWHTYRVEVRGSQFTLRVDGRTLLTDDEDTYGSDRQVGLTTAGNPMRVASFEVVAL